MKTIIIFAWRHLRGQWRRVLFFSLCMAVGVAARVGTGTFLVQIEEATAREARPLLMGDLDLRSSRPLSEREAKILDGILPPGSARQTLKALVTMIQHADSGHSLPVELRVIEAQFPWYGDLELRTEQDGPPAAVGTLFTPEPGVYVQTELLRQAGLQIGDTLTLGREHFRVLGWIDEEPGTGATFLSLGPRILLGRDHLAATGLVGDGARVTYHELIRLPEGADAEKIAADLRALLLGISPGRAAFRGMAGPGDSLQVLTYRDSGNQISRFFDQLGDYLRLSALLALVLGGLGIASLARGFLDAGREDYGVLKTLGMTPAQLSFMLLLQTLLIGFGAGIAGGVLGALVPNSLVFFFNRILPFEVRNAWPLSPFLWGMVLGILTTLFFMVWPFVRMVTMKPAAILFRRPEIGRWSPCQWLLLVAGLLLLLGVAVLETRSTTKGGLFVLILVASAIFLRGSGALLLRGISSLRSRFRSPGVRLGLANLRRGGMDAETLVVTLGLSMVFLGLTLVYQASLERLLDPRGQDGGALPDFFLIDLQTAQVPAMEALSEKHQAVSWVFSPMIKARYRELNQQPVTVEDLGRTREDATARSMRQREQNLSYREGLGISESLVAGNWINPRSGQVEFSLEERFAGRIGANLGDTLSFDIQGVPLEGVVTSLRRVNWSSFEPNFFILVTPEVLRDAPQVWVGSVSGLRGENKHHFSREVYGRFPNVTLFDVGSMARKILALAGQMVWAVRGLSVFLIGAGMLVLAGSIAATLRERRMEASLLKVLGGSRKTLMMSLLVEFTTIAFTAAALGLLAAIFASWIWMNLALQIPWVFPWKSGLCLVFLLALLCGGFGCLFSGSVFRVKPALVFRNAVH